MARARRTRRRIGISFAVGWPYVRFGILDDVHVQGVATLAVVNLFGIVVLGQARLRPGNCVTFVDQEVFLPLWDLLIERRMKLTKVERRLSCVCRRLAR